MSLVGSFDSAGAARKATRRAVAFTVVALLIADLAGLYKVKSRVRPVTVDEAVQTFRQAQAQARRGPAGGETIATVPASASVAEGTAAASAPVAAPGRLVGKPGQGAAASRSTTAAAASTPAAGVYVYATSGSEAVSALNTSHTYPDQTTITVMTTACGDDARWDGLKERWDLWNQCTVGHAITLSSFTTYHDFLGQVVQRTYTCGAGTYFRPPSDEPGTTFAGRCSADDGSTAALNGRVAGLEAVVVGGTSVPAVHVRIDEVLTGSTHGTRWSDSWYRVADGLLLKRVSQTDADTKAAFGDTHYTEQLNLSLSSLDPRR